MRPRAGLATLAWLMLSSADVAAQDVANEITPQGDASAEVRGPEPAPVKDAPEKAKSDWGAQWGVEGAPGEVGQSAEVAKEAESTPLAGSVGGKAVASTQSAQQAQDPSFRIERLPPSRELYVRGIPGGSMEMIWHGLQWPHYPVTGLPFSGNIWVDSGYEKQDRSLNTENDRSFWLQQGRFLLRATPTYSNGNFFVQAQGELLAWVNVVPGNLPIDVDDAWVRLGQWDKWDLQVGRFEGWEIYHKGMGLERDTLEDVGAFDDRDTTVVDIYEVNYAFYRQNGYGQAAAHYYPFKFLRFEVGGVLGNEVAFNALGVRPVGILDFGWVKLKVGGEYRKAKDWESNQPREETQRGAGASLQFVYGTLLEGGLNAAYGVTDRIGPDGRVNEKGSPTTASAGAFMNVRPVGKFLVGAGANYTDQDNRQFNDQVGDVGHYRHLQVFGALQHAIFTDAFTAKLVVAYARAKLDESFDNDKTNKMMSARLRLRYVF